MIRSTHFVHSFSKLSEIFVYNYVIALKKQGVEVRVLTFNRLNKNERPFESVDIIKLPIWNAKRAWNIARDKFTGKDTETSAWPVYREKIIKILGDDPPNILHAHFGPMGVLLEPVSRELNIPLVVTFYGYDISEITQKPFWQRAYRQLAKTTSCVTVLSEEMKERAIDLGFRGDQIKVIHLGVNIDQIKYQPPVESIREFISVGRLSEKKGHLDTLKAFNAVLEQTNEPLKLTIIGEGPDRKKLASLIKSKNLQKNVSLAGRMPHDNVIKQLYEADAFILNSKTAGAGDMEGTPTVLIEAQAAGLPCISTFHSGIPEIIPVENHRFLAEEGNIDQITNNIVQLIGASKDELNEVSRLGRKRVEEAFDVTGEVEKFKQLYKQLAYA